MEQTDERPESDEISLIDLFAVLWQRKKLIIAITLIAAIGVVTFSVISLVLPPEISPLPNEYTPQAHMLINNSSSSGGSMVSALQSSGLGGLAGLAGISGGQTYSELAKYLLGANTLLDSVVDTFDLIEKYKIKIEKSPRAESRKALKKVLTAEFDEKSGVFTVSFTDKDPVFAQQVVNYCVEYLSDWFKVLGLDKNILQKTNLEQNIQNTFSEIRRLEEENQKLGQSVSLTYENGTVPSITLETRRLALELSAQQDIYRQLKVQLELTNVAMASETPIFQILEHAEVPDQKSGPGRGMLCIIVTFGAFFFAVFLAFLLNAIENIRKDPEAMSKLRTRRENNKKCTEDEDFKKRTRNVPDNP